MRIGIVPRLDQAAGGIYQYSLTVIDSLQQWSETHTDDEFVLFPNVDLPTDLSYLMDKPRWSVQALPSFEAAKKARLIDHLRNAVGEGPLRQAWRKLRQAQRGNRTVPAVVDKESPVYDQIRFQPELGQWLRSAGIDLLLLTAPLPIGFETEVPYVMAIHDMQHRLHPEFPEVGADGEWESREYIFRNGARHATAILVDSEVGKEDVLDAYGLYGVTPDRVKILPFQPASYLSMHVSAGERQRVRVAYDLPERFLFYPAQFWAHKNHMGIVKALGILKKTQRAAIPIVLCGSHSGIHREREYQTVMAKAVELGVQDQLYYLGYVPDEDMSVLYAEAEALIMPTYFGPTNIPVLEAWAFGCPVLTSDIRGIQQQAADAAVLADPASPEAIANGIYRLWTDEGLRQTLAVKGKQRLDAYTPDDFRTRLVHILQEAQASLVSKTAGV